MNMKMNSRERYIRALKFEGPDRVPIMHRTLPGAFHRYGRALEELYERYPSDVLLSPTVRAPFRFSDPVEECSGKGRMLDQWGCTWTFLTDDYAGQVIEHPLADWDALSSYRFPDPLLGEEGVEEMVEVVRRDRHQHYVMVHAGTLWHRLTYLRGFENALIDVAEKREELLYLRDRIVDYILKRIERWGEHGELVDGILILDDWGTQRALMIRPSTWREIFRPAYSKLVAAIHSVGAYAHFHSDGVTEEIIGDLIEIGLDEVNPQLSCMDMRRLSCRFGGRVCFRADLDRQWTLPYGSVVDVEAHVHEAFESFGKFNGGLVGYGQIGPDVPLENAEAMLKTIWSLKYEL